MNSTFSFLPFFKVLWHRLFWIILVALIGSGVGYALLKKYYVPQYTATAVVDVHHNKTKGGSYSDQLTTDINNMTTVQSQISDLGIYNDVSSNLKKDHNMSVSAKYIQSHVQISIKDSSTILYVVTTTDNPNKASQISNAVIQSYRNKYEKKNDALIVNQLSKARASDASVSVTPYLEYVKDGAIVGGSLAYVVCLLLYFKNENKKSGRFK